MTIILDKNLPRGLLRILDPHPATTVQQVGHTGLKNGDPLAKLEGFYDVFLTADKNLRCQQNLARPRLAIIELPTNRWPILRAILPRVVNAIDRREPGSYTVVSTEQA